MHSAKEDTQKMDRPILTAISRLVEHPFFTRTVIGLIILNTILVGLETYPSLSVYRELFLLIDQVILGAFTLEITLRLLASQSIIHYFKDKWNLFDFMIVAGSFFLADAHFITLLRILRILRILRTITVIPSLRNLVNALLLTIPTLGNISLLLGIFFYVFGVTGTILFSSISPDYFGSLHQTFLTLFQVVTLDTWASEIMRPILNEMPWAWVYFLSFILIGTFVILNLFIGVIVSKVESVDPAEPNKEKEIYQLRDEVTLLRNEIKELKTLLLSKDQNQPFR